MVKNLLQDVLPKERKSVRLPVRPISPPPPAIPQTDRYRISEERAPREEETVIRYKEPELHTIEYAHTRRFKWQLWVPVLVAVAILLYASTYFLSGATVTVTQKQQIVSVNLSLRAAKVPVAGELGFAVIPLVREAEQVVPANGMKYVDTKASGTIIVYNNFSTASQRLITNTRFQTPAGLVYRIHSSIIIPGKTTQNGVTVPGSVEAVVYADSPGAEYNGGRTDFSIPGFKNNAARYAGFYGRSKTPMIGGFSGLAKSVDDATLAAAHASLRANLEKQLLDEARKETPAGYVLYDKAYAISFEDEPNVDADPAGKNSTVRERGTFTGYVLSRTALTKEIATRALPHYDGASVEIQNLEALLLSLPQINGDAGLSVLPFTLKGDAKLVWKYDEEKFRNDLAGKPKSAIPNILAAHPGILSADVVIRPFWNSTFPANFQKITVQKAGK